MSCSQTRQLRSARREIKKLDRSSTTTFVTPLLCPKLPQDNGPILSVDKGPWQSADDHAHRAEAATRFRMRERLTGRLGRENSNLCILESEFTQTLNPGGRTRTCASRIAKCAGSTLKKESQTLTPGPAPHLHGEVQQI